LPNDADYDFPLASTGSAKGAHYPVQLLQNVSPLLLQPFFREDVGDLPDDGEDFFSPYTRLSHR
jgi:hypothetical protein